MSFVGGGWDEDVLRPWVVGEVRVPEELLGALPLTKELLLGTEEEWRAALEKAMAEPQIIIPHREPTIVLNIESMTFRRWAKFRFVMYRQRYQAKRTCGHCGMERWVHKSIGWQLGEQCVVCWVQPDEIGTTFEPVEPRWRGVVNRLRWW